MSVDVIISEILLFSKSNKIDKEDNKNVSF